MERLRLQQRHKRSFTLVEMMIAIAVLVIACGGGAFAYRSFAKDPFKESVQTVISCIDFAQEALLDYDTDVALLFQKDAGEICCRLLFYKPLPEALEKKIGAKHVLKEVTSVIFKDKRDDFTLIFSTCQAQGPRGELLIKGKKEAYVSLHKENIHETPPYPQEILSST